MTTRRGSHRALEEIEDGTIPWRTGALRDLPRPKDRDFALRARPVPRDAGRGARRAGRDRARLRGRRARGSSRGSCGPLRATSPRPTRILKPGDILAGPARGRQLSSDRRSRRDRRARRLSQNRCARMSRASVRLVVGMGRPPSGGRQPPSRAALEFGDELLYDAAEDKLGRELTLNEVIALEFRACAPSTRSSPGCGRTCACAQASQSSPARRTADRLSGVPRA